MASLQWHSDRMVPPALWQDSFGEVSFWLAAPIHPALQPSVDWIEVVLLDHGAGYQTLYAHLQQFSVQPCDSGKVTGPHLHFELLQHGQAQDPMLHLPLLSSAGTVSR